jgi:outer membrane protein
VNKKLLSFIVLFIICGWLQKAQAQSLKIGFVNSAKILQEYPEAQEVNKKLDDLAAKWQSELARMSNELQQKYDDFQKKEALMQESEKKIQREELANLEQKGYQYRQQKFGTNGELAAATDSLLGPVKKKVLKVIEDVAKKEHLQFVFDRNDQITVLLYGESKYDYTHVVIDQLTRGKSSN